MFCASLQEVLRSHLISVPSVFQEDTGNMKWLITKLGKIVVHIVFKADIKQYLRFMLLYSSHEKYHF